MALRRRVGTTKTVWWWMFRQPCYWFARSQRRRHDLPTPSP